MPLPSLPESGDKSPQHVEFTFVTDQNQHSARSHAMREHWKQRRQRLSEEKKRKDERQPRPILPSRQSGSSHSRATSHSQHSLGNYPNPTPAAAPTVDGIPAQALSGMNLALGCGRLDPFDRFPVKLTTQHHKLLHHCNSFMKNI